MPLSYPGVTPAGREFGGQGDQDSGQGGQDSGQNQ